MSSIKKNKAKSKAEIEQNANSRTDYDSAWKDVIERLFEPFTAFFFPDIHKDIDFTQGIEILDSELREIAPYGKVGKRYADELVKVHLKDGSLACVWVFIHIEVQGTKEKKGIFPERAYIYNYRIYDKNIDKGIKVISVAILTDEDETYRPDEYLVRQWGFELRMKIPLIKIVDFKHDKDLKKLLETSNNPMAMVVSAQLKSYDLRKAANEQKSSVKWELIRRCYDKKYPKEDIRVILKFIDWIIRLPEGLNKQLSKKIAILEEEYKMPYITSWERTAKKEGLREGIREGKREGKVEGKVEGKREGIKKGMKEGFKVGMENKAKETAKKMLDDGLSIESISKYTGLPIGEIKKLMTVSN